MRFTGGQLVLAGCVASLIAGCASSSKVDSVNRSTASSASGPSGSSGPSANGPTVSSSRSRAVGNPALCEAFYKFIAAPIPKIKRIAALPSDRMSQLVAGLPTPVLVASAPAGHGKRAYLACFAAATASDARRVIGAANNLGYTVLIRENSQHAKPSRELHNMLVSGMERRMPGVEPGETNLAIDGLGGLDVLTPSGAGSIVVGYED